jgi:8-oxo-dGTP pyrophosphatase MutT (NUDIX family)
MYKDEQNIIQCRHRVAAIFLHEGHLLLQGEPQGTFWTLPGGGIELLESSQEALKREMREELNIDIQIERLIWITEEFFMADALPEHQLGFYYLTTPLAAPHIYNLERTIIAVEENNANILFQWFSYDQLDTITLYPTFLPTAIQALPITTEHITLIDDDVQRWRNRSL